MNEEEKRHKADELFKDFKDAIGNHRILVSMREVAMLTGVSKSTVVRWINSRSLKSLKPKNNKRARRSVHLRDLADFFAGVN